MTVDVVADVGNSRVKWGLCQPAREGQGETQAVLEYVSLPADDFQAWSRQLERWQLPSAGTWVVCGVQPRRREALSAWLQERGFFVHLLTAPQQLPLCVRLERPEQVGIDRLLNAVAVNCRRQPGQPAIIVDAGSAVTVDYLDGEGAFCGGAIFPGLHLMARALHEHTALLPLVEVRRVLARPGTSTPEAMELGLLHAVTGGIASLRQAYLAGSGHGQAQLFLGGGDASLLAMALPLEAIVWPTMTLEGIRLAAASWPA